MKNLDYVGNASAVVFTAVQTNEILQIISVILTCISILFSLSFTIYKWYKASLADKKITMEELEDLKDKVDEHIDKINNVINDKEDNEK